jgi:hypothetical protein
MSIKNKSGFLPPEDDLPPYAKDTPCWGCGNLFDFTELLAKDEGLCTKCAKTVRKTEGST